MLSKEKIVSLVCCFITGYFVMVATKGIFTGKYELNEILNFYAVACFVLSFGLRPALFFTDIKQALINSDAVKSVVSSTIVNYINILGLILIIASVVLRVQL
ncbi:hypothetical protein JQC92_22380 [Shewanella sp. 202IG2-18]|uniref:hypothetical protein n=1 Tax=Parashewanella hymeniacidonis TaxID=2807618 RepID=UPI00195FA083|nr:hypothetical protein [Parashewanella hymeniacidonis]MBM7074719.1 hypothetical protein [Parashewanella hymeniacidonis]